MLAIKCANWTLLLWMPAGAAASKTCRFLKKRMEQNAAWLSDASRWGTALKWETNACTRVLTAALRMIATEQKQLY